MHRIALYPVFFMNTKIRLKPFLLAFGISGLTKLTFKIIQKIVINEKSTYFNWTYKIPVHRVVMLLKSYLYVIGIIMQSSKSIEYL